jgi:hypothetical protein
MVSRMRCPLIVPWFGAACRVASRPLAGCRLPASALGLLLPAGRWRRPWCNPRRRVRHGSACRRTRPAGLVDLVSLTALPSGLCRAAVPKSPCPLALILGVTLASSLQIHAFLEAPKWMGQAPFSPSAATAPLLGRRSCDRPARGESCASCSQRYAREDAAYAHDALSCLAREVQTPRRFVQRPVVGGGAAGTHAGDPGSLARAQATGAQWRPTWRVARPSWVRTRNCRGPAYRSRP